MMTKEGSTKIINFMTPGVGLLVLGRGHIIYTVKLYKPGIDQTNKCLVMMTKEGSTKFVIYDPRGRGSFARAWPYKSYSENALFFNIKILFFPPRHRSDKIST